ncbi:hypothetical protein PHJA_001343000 [Phtheirospermum japonicum]|uniref:Uncharacterized protein n=1 Tax=Phtheirospermum japonicum TaxID=374723 RepID=A0A830BZB6_9LAMI|nr:hypothetical protein PHJA_001343000 [Phtheirospermum japonicum]
MVSDERVTSGRLNRLRRKEIGGRRTCGGTERAATPFMERKLDSADRNRGCLHGDGGGAAAEAVSARKLAASLWYLAATTNGNGSVTWLFDRLRFEIPKSTTEGATKWDYCNSKARYNIGYFRSKFKSIDLVKTRKHLNEVESEKMRLNEERASRMRTEHQKMCTIAKNLKGGVKSEKKNKNKIDIVNSKLVRDIAEAKLSARKFMRNLGKEKKARECLEDLCNRLAKEVEGYKAEIGALRSQQENILEEAEKERNLMQIAEVWREEQAQMKLIDVKLILENKFAEMNNVIAEFKAFSKNEVGIETVTQAEICSSRELFESEGSVNKIRRSKYVSNNIAHHGSKKSESSEISSVSLNQSEKKGTFGSNKLQRALPRNKGGGRVSNRTDKGEVKIRINPHVVRAMKGHIEWPRGIERRCSAEADLLEAKLESQKIIMRNVLKQRS